MKRRLAYLIIAALVLTLVPAVALAAEEGRDIIVYDPVFGLPEDPNPEEYSLWNIVDNEDYIFGTRATRVYSNLMFMETHPGVKVVEKPFNVWNQQATMTGLAAGEPYPYYRPFTSVYQAVHDGMLADITDIVEEEGLLDMVPREKWPDAWVNDRLYLLSWDGRIVTSPLAFRRDMFREAGLEEPDDDWTWEDFREAAKALTQDTDGDGRIDVWGVSAFADCGFGAIAYSYGAPPGLVVPDKSGRYTWRSALTDPACIKALELLNKMAVEDKSILTGTEVNYSEVYSNFRGGRAAMVFQINSDHHVLYKGGFKGLFGDEDLPDTHFVGLANYPRGPEGVRISTKVISSFGFNPRLSEEELRAAVQKAIWDWYGYGKGLRNLDRYLRTGNPYHNPFVQCEPPNLGYPAREEFIPKEYLESELERQNTPLFPNAAKYGLANIKGFQEEINALVQDALTNPNFDAKRAAAKTASYINRTILNYKLKGTGPEDFKAFYTELAEWYKKHYPEFYNGRFQEMWEEYYKVW